MRCLPPPRSHGPVAGAPPPCGCQRGARALRGPLPIVATLSPLSGGRAHTVPRCRLACAIAQLRVPLVVLGAAVPRPLHDLHAVALCTSHSVCMGCRCPTLLVPARCAGGGRGGRGSLLPVAYGAAPFGAEAPTPASRAGCTSAAPCGGKGEGKGGAEASASPIMLPPRRGWGGGEPGGAWDAVRVRDIVEKASLTGRAAPRSAVEGSATTRGASVVGREGGKCSCPPGPISPEPPRLSARTGRPPPPPPVWLPAGSRGAFGT